MFFWHFFASGVTNYTSLLLDKILHAYDHKSPKEELLCLVNNCLNQIDSLECKKNKINYQSSSAVKLSIVIECFGNLNHLDDLLNSINSQKLDFNYELIFLSTNSALMSKKIVNVKKTFKNRIATLSNRDRYNFFDKCQGELVLYVSEYDIIPPLILQRLINFQSYCSSPIIALSNIIAFNEGEFGVVPSHSKFYTTTEMGSSSYDLFDLLNDDKQCFLWGLKNNCYLFTRSVWHECGCFFDFNNDLRFNFALCALFKGYEFKILSNSFFYHYYEGKSWFSDIFINEINNQINIINNNFSEFLISGNKINHVFLNLSFLDHVALKNILQAYQYERHYDYQAAYKQYLLAINSGVKHIKIYLKCFRAFLLANLAEDLDLNFILHLKNNKNLYKKVGLK